MSIKNVFAIACALRCFCPSSFQSKAEEEEEEEPLLIGDGSGDDDEKRRLRFEIETLRWALDDVEVLVKSLEQTSYIWRINCSKTAFSSSARVEIARRLWKAVAAGVEPW